MSMEYNASHMYCFWAITMWSFFLLPKISEEKLLLKIFVTLTMNMGCSAVQFG